MTRIQIIKQTKIVKTGKQTQKLTRVLVIYRGSERLVK